MRRALAYLLVLGLGVGLVEEGYATVLGTEKQDGVRIEQ